MSGSKGNARQNCREGWSRRLAAEPTPACEAAHADAAGEESGDVTVSVS